MYLMDGERPCYRTFAYFIKDVLEDNIEGIFCDVNKEIFEKDHVDLQHIYIDGTKLEANANKYTWVWKKATEKSRYRLFAKITTWIDVNNQDLAKFGIQINLKPEYAIEELEPLAEQYLLACNVKKSDFVHGKGCRKSNEQRQYETLIQYIDKLKVYATQIEICGPDRNSYSKTDPSATFMRVKTDYMGNDQLLPCYNFQIGVADGYVAVVDVNQYRSDMDCFIPLMDKFYDLYHFYPKYPIADAGYGNYDNYLYCEQHGMEKYMKFTMYNKETTDPKYHDNPFRAVNFKRDENGCLICPNGKKFFFSYRKAVKGNKYGRQDEVYVCEDCSECPYAQQCKKSSGNRTITMNEELTSFHEEVLNNLENIHGALLRMNRSIQAEGTFGVMKQDRNYNRIVRRGLKSVKCELLLVALGHNLYKYCNNITKALNAA